jgi:hypothetical protein
MNMHPVQTARMSEYPAQTAELQVLALLVVLAIIVALAAVFS